MIYQCCDGAGIWKPPFLQTMTRYCRNIKVADGLIREDKV